MSDEQNPLSIYSEEQLAAELARRRGEKRLEKGLGTNRDWYFFRDSESREDFNIVHKRLYHTEHVIDDNHISGRIILPTGFGEAQESIFEYEGEPEEGEQALRDFGFVKLEKPYFDGLLVYAPVERVGWPRIDINADTPEIKEFTRRWINESLPPRSAALPHDWNRDSFLGKLEAFSRSSGFAHFVRDYNSKPGYWPGASVSIMSDEVAKSLPLYPNGYRD